MGGGGEDQNQALVGERKGCVRVSRLEEVAVHQVVQLVRGERHPRGYCPTAARGRRTSCVPEACACWAGEIARPRRRPPSSPPPGPAALPLLPSGPSAGDCHVWSEGKWRPRGPFACLGGARPVSPTKERQRAPRAESRRARGKVGRGRGPRMWHRRPLWALNGEIQKIWVNWLELTQTFKFGLVWFGLLRVGAICVGETLRFRIEVLAGRSIGALRKQGEGRGRVIGGVLHLSLSVEPFRTTATDRKPVQHIACASAGCRDLWISSGETGSVFATSGANAERRAPRLTRLGSLCSAYHLSRCAAAVPSHRATQPRPPQRAGRPLHRNVLWYRGGLVFEAHRLLHHSDYGSRTF